MAQGYSAAGNCWPTQAEAIDAYYSNWSAPSSFYSEANTGFAAAKLFYTHKVGATWYFKWIDCSANFCTQATGNGLAAPTNITGICTIPEAGTTGGTTAPTTYDYDAMAQFWFFGLSIIVSFFVLGRGAGVVLDIFRK